MSTFEKPGGGSREVPADEALALDPHSVLTNLFASCKHIPRQLPQSPGQAARAWMNLQEPPSEPTRYYVQRILATARAFLRVDDHLRDLIVDARNEPDGPIWWRGEDYETFMRVIGEYATMREMGVKAYRMHAMTRIKNLRMKGVV